MRIEDSLAADVQSRTPDGFSALSSEDFMKIMFTELANQDPLEPQDSSKLLEQIQSLRSIESDLDLQQTLQDLTEQSARSSESFAELQETLTRMTAQSWISSAGVLIGKHVSGTDSFGDPVAGVVSAVTVSGDSVTLQLTGGGSLPLENVDQVNEPQNGGAE
ncbi:MAG: hypothetical protein KAS72_01040 [Phycisphaerales bacterium]|nr:hypothetical protein [Phycisphaerales bacterium]